MKRGISRVRRAVSAGKARTVAGCLLLAMGLVMPHRSQAADAQAAARAPALIVETQVLAAGSLPVHGTTHLQVDVLTPTWFLAPPTLPALQIPGVVVSPPSAHAQSLRIQRDGTAYTALRYTYLLSPLAHGRFTIPAFDVSAPVGEHAGMALGRSAASTLQADVLPGADANALVADAVRARQTFELSADPPRVGDRIRRSIEITADGALPILIPDALSGEVAHTRRYAVDPEVAELRDGRGGFIGGRRREQSDYVTLAAGPLEFAPITIVWWQAATGTRQAVTLPGRHIDIRVRPTTPVPFDVGADLRAMRSRGDHLVGVHGAMRAAGFCVLLAVVASALRRRRFILHRARLVMARCRKAWTGSELHAWFALRRACHGAAPAASLSPLYLWLRRMNGAPTMKAAIDTVALPARSHLHSAAAQALAQLYGDSPDAACAWRRLRQLTVILRRAHRTESQRGRTRLAPLNPPRRAPAGASTGLWSRPHRGPQPLPTQEKPR